MQGKNPQKNLFFCGFYYNTFERCFFSILFSHLRSMKHVTTLSKTKTLWFTLVELIVVITIIAILGTVGFVSYSSYLTSVRDANRISQLVRIADALQIYSTNKDLPLPDNYVDIQSKWSSFAYQGYLWDATVQAIEYSTVAKDPKDDLPYTYYVSWNRNAFQLLAYMEEASSVRSEIQGVSSVHAQSYEMRYPKVYGNRIWVMTDDENIPIQESLKIFPSGATGTSAEESNAGNKVLDIQTIEEEVIVHLGDEEYIKWGSDDIEILPELVQSKGKDWVVDDNILVEITKPSSLYIRILQDTWTSQVYRTDNITSDTRIEITNPEKIMSGAIVEYTINGNASSPTWRTAGVKTEEVEIEVSTSTEKITKTATFFDAENLLDGFSWLHEYPAWEIRVRQIDADGLMSNTHLSKNTSMWKFDNSSGWTIEFCWPGIQEC